MKAQALAALAPCALASGCAPAVAPAGAQPAAKGPTMYGVVMDIDIQGATATLVSFATGDTSPHPASHLRTAGRIGTVMRNFCILPPRPPSASWPWFSLTFGRNQSLHLPRAIG
jgi:hypothetical protein